DNLKYALKEIDRALARMPTRDGSSDCWARSERARLCKACDSLRARQQALLEARGSGWSLPPSQKPAVPEDGMHWSGHKRPRGGEEAGREPGAGRDSKQMSSGFSPARFEPIDERNASTLGYEEFIETYALRGRPVILKGGVSLCFEGGRAWSRESLRKAVGEKIVPVRRWVPDSVSWARLDDAGQAPFASLLGPPPPAAPAPAAAAEGDEEKTEGESELSGKKVQVDGDDVVNGGGGGTEEG
ncbi:unnamed protein product, partial [Laminaria digitata]